MVELLKRFVHRESYRYQVHFPSTLRYFAARSKERVFLLVEAQWEVDRDLQVLRRVILYPQDVMVEYSNGVGFFALLTNSCGHAI
jgi:hypothetical protein